MSDRPTFVALVWQSLGLLLAWAMLLVLLTPLLASAQQVILTTKEQQTLKALMGPSGTIEQLIITETASHPLSSPGTARIMADSVTHALLCSFNGGAYATCTGGGGGDLTGSGLRGNPATWTSSSTVLTSSPFYTDVKQYGAVCDGSSNIQTAMAAAISDGKTRLFIPGHAGSECIWIPAGNLIPANIEIIGEDWNNTTIQSSNPAVNSISLGNNSLVRNVRFKHKACTDAPGAPTYCPARWIHNTTGASQPLGNWPNQPFAFYVGGLDQGSTDRPGLYGQTVGEGDAIFLINTNAGPSLRVYSQGTATSAGIEVQRWTNLPGIRITSETGATTDYSFDIQSSLQTGGGLMRLRQTTSAFNGDMIVGDMAAGSGTFGGKFLNFMVNSVAQATLSAAGDLVLATALKVPSGGTGATTLTGLVKGNGASAMTAYAGSSCTPGSFVTSLDLNGVATCDVPGGGGDVTHSSGALTANALILGNGGGDIKALGSLGTTTTVLHGNAGGAPTFGAVVEDDITLSNNTTLDCNFTKHGLVPLAPNDTAKFLRGDCTWATTTGSFAPADATFLTMTLNGTLTNERVLTAGTGIGIADGGANSTATVSVAQATNFAWTGTHTWNQQAAVTLLPYGVSAGNTGELRMRELAANGSNYIAFGAPDNIASNFKLVWPNALPGSTQCMAFDATGAGSFQACSSGITGSGANTQVTVWTGAAAQTGYSAFTYTDATKILSLAGSLRLKGPNPYADVTNTSFAGGATCNGVADDTSAIQAALDSGAGIVQLPSQGDCGVSGSIGITIPASVTLRGPGRGAGGLKRIGSSGANLINISKANVAVLDMEIDNNGVDANVIAITATPSGSFDTPIFLDGLTIANTSHVVSGANTNCSADNDGNTHVCAAVYVNANNVPVILRDVVASVGSAGLKILNSTIPVYATDSIFRANANAGILTSGSGFGFFGTNLFIQANQDGANVGLNQFHLYNSFIEDNTRYGVFASAGDVRLINNFGGCPAATKWFKFSGDVSPMQTTGNELAQPDTTCVAIEFASYPGSPSYTSTVTNNKIDGATGTISIPSNVIAWGNSQKGSSGGLRFISQSPQLIATATTAHDDLWVFNADSSGANILLTHSGATNPNKYLRSNSGNFEILNSAYSSTLWQLSNAGLATLRTATSAYGYRHTDGTTSMSTFIGSGIAWFGTDSNHTLNFYTNGGGSALRVNTDSTVSVPTYTGAGTVVLCVDSAGKLVRGSSGSSC